MDNNLRLVELQKFANNAADLLLSQGRLEEFFQSIGYEASPHQDGYRGMCPACLQSFCFVGVNGGHHRIYWKCFDRRCRSNTEKTAFCRNLLGLVRGVSDDSRLSTAIDTLATFLGFKNRSFDITNGKYEAAPMPMRTVGGGAAMPPF